MFNEASQIKLSVIVPAYNSEMYITECLNSLTRQGFNSHEHEVIIVNDGSTDRTKEIVSSFCEQYDYMQIINQRNGGVSSARNTGMSMAKGKYIAFVDSDDYVVDNCYSGIIDVMEKNNLEGLYFGYTPSKDKLQVFDLTFHYPEYSKSCRMSACRVVFLRSIIVENGLLFDERIAFNEDFLFNYKFIRSMTTAMASTSKRLYYCRDNPESVTHGLGKGNSHVDSKHFNSVLNACMEIKRFTQSKNIEFDALYYDSISKTMMNLLWGAMIARFNPIKVVNTIEKKGLSLKDIKVKAFEGNGKKYEFKSWVEYQFRFKYIYYIVCYLYRILNALKSIRQK